jgi:NADH dehydrogenase/NADH:ubiquinone oxidoreductase subunit G
MSDEILLTIDGQRVLAASGKTILQAARSLGIEIPTLCVHEATRPKAVCRTCVVEVQGARVLQAACVTQVSPGMVVYTQSERVIRSRRTILELLNSAVDLSEAPELQTMMDECQADRQRFPEAQARQPAILDDNPMFIRDYARCVLCWRCVQVCAGDAQHTYAIDFSGRGFETQIGTFFEHPLPETPCVFCGQCIGVCPTNALKTRRQWLLEQGFSPGEITATAGSTRRRRKR